jgi:hypothetical protein
MSDSPALSPPASGRSFGADVALSTAIGLVVLFAVPALHAMVWHESIDDLIASIELSWLQVAVIAAGILVHEALHLAGFAWFGGAKRYELRLVFKWKYLAPCAGCTAAMPLRAYRAAAVLPGFALGAIPAIVGIAINWTDLMWFGCVFFATSAGDGLSIWVTRRLPPDTIVRDRESGLGCEVVVT